MKKVIILLLCFGGLVSFSDSFSRTEITLISAEIAATKTDGTGWDFGNNMPDPFVKIFVDGDPVFTSSIQRDTLNPNWNESFAIAIERTQRIRIEVWDGDISFNDPIGTWNGDSFPSRDISFGQVRRLSIK